MDGETLQLNGVAGDSHPSQIGSDAILRHGEVTLRGAGPPLRYRIPYWAVYRGGHELSVVGSRSVHGYLCLVRFHPGERAAAIVADEPIFMGGGPQLVVLDAAARHVQTTPGGFRLWAITTSIGPPVLATDDTRFFGIGVSDADSGDPLRILTVDSNGLITNVSADYPHHLDHDAAKWWHLFQHHNHGPYLGAIASWAADECSLGHQALAFRELDDLQAAHRFARFTLIVHGQFRPVNYARYVERRLIRWGYAS